MMEAVSVPVVLPTPGGLGIHCKDGEITSDWVFDLATGRRRTDVHQIWLRLFAGADPLDVEVEVITSNSAGDITVKRLRGKDVTFSLRIQGV